MRENCDIQLVAEPIDISAAYAALEDPSCGGVVLFVGRVRAMNEGRAVTAIDYTAYPAMVIAESERLWREATEQWPLRRGAIIHRIGHLPVGTISIVIGVAAPHRNEAFTAARYLIDAFKQRVPIWKEEC